MKNVQEMINSKDVPPQQLSYGIYKFSWDTYDIIENYHDGTAKYLTTPKKLLLYTDSNGKKVYSNYRFSETDSQYKVETMKGSIIYNKNDCAFSIYPAGKITTSPTVPSVSWIVKTAENGTNTWSSLSEVNSQTCKVSYWKDPHGVVITSVKGVDYGVHGSRPETVEVGSTSDTSITVNGTSYPLTTIRIQSQMNNSTGTMDTVEVKGYTFQRPLENYRLSSTHRIAVSVEGGIKESLTIENNDQNYPNSKFGATQTLHIGESFTAGQQVITTAQNNGNFLDRNWLNQNQGVILGLGNDLNYNFDVAYAYIWGIRVIDDGAVNKLALDYANVGNQIIPVGGALTIDPTTSVTGATSGSNWTFDLSSIPASTMKGTYSATLDGSAVSSSDLTAIKAAAGGTWTKAKPSTTFTVTSGGTAKVLVVAGGGAGGGGYGGGGGAGGYLYSASKSIAAGSYTPTIGLGGTKNRMGYF